MAVYSDERSFRTRGENDVVDLTDTVNDVLKHSGLREGLVNIFVPGSTGAVTTIEYEPGLMKDLPAALERFAPRDAKYEHHLTWGDYNGHSHVRAAVVGPSLTVPFSQGRAVLGTWQQVVFIEMDVRSRGRRILLTAIGE